MNDQLAREFQDESRHMTLEEKKVLMRALLCLNVHCERCPIKSPGFDRDPCYGCIVLPPECRRPMSTVN